MLSLQDTLKEIEEAQQRRKQQILFSRQNAQISNTSNQLPNIQNNTYNPSNVQNLSESTSIIKDNRAKKILNANIDYQQNSTADTGNFSRLGELQKKLTASRESKTNTRQSPMLSSLSNNVDSLKQYQEALNNSSSDSGNVSAYTGKSKFGSSIAKYSEKYGVSSDLIKKVINAESSFNPNAVSKTGNKGLMQVSNGLLKGAGVSNWKNPDANIMVGTKYLSGLIKQFGSIDKAIASYNAGPGRVSGLIKKYGSNWKKYLPNETKNYLAKILG